MQEFSNDTGIKDVYLSVYPITMKIEYCEEQETVLKVELTVKV